MSEFPTVGILGGGQLARMLATAAHPLGLSIRMYQTDDSGPARATPEVFTGDWHDEDLLRRFLDGCDVVTLDNEWAQLGTIARLAGPVPLYPSVSTMELISDKIRQKDHARAQGLPVGDYRACASLDEVESAAREFGYPVVLKRPSHSYDGYGNRTARDDEALRAAYSDISDDGRILVEKWVPFERELAVMVARRPGGDDVVYPVAGTVQRDHKCEAVEVPAPIAPEVATEATALARRVAAAYGCVGVVGVELFMRPDGTLLLNELAPRPHNTGHYTIEACVTSQFENHLRAVLDLPLGETSLLRPAAVMVNVLGHREGLTSAASLPAALELPQAKIHVYGKDQVRPGRKMGHVTALADRLEDARTVAYEAARRLQL